MNSLSDGSFIHPWIDTPKNLSILENRRYAGGIYHQMEYYGDLNYLRKYPELEDKQEKNLLGLILGLFF